MRNVEKLEKRKKEILLVIIIIIVTIGIIYSIFSEKTENIEEISSVQKEENNVVSTNNIIEDEIEGNDSLELLYAWTKCSRMITGAKAFVRMVNDEYNIEGNDHVIKATTILHKHLKENGKANTSDLFNILQIRELSLLVKYPPLQRTINTPYEFERAIVKEDESEAYGTWNSSAGDSSGSGLYAAWQEQRDCGNLRLCGRRKDRSSGG